MTRDPTAPTAPGDHVGHPLELGAPSWTDDGTHLVVLTGPVTRPRLDEP